MDLQIAFYTGYLWGYLATQGVEALPVFDGEGNYLPQIDITVPADTSKPAGEMVTVRVEVIQVNP